MIKMDTIGAHLFYRTARRLVVRRPSSLIQASSPLARGAVGKRRSSMRTPLDADVRVEPASADSTASSRARFGSPIDAARATRALSRNDGRGPCASDIASPRLLSSPARAFAAEPRDHRSGRGLSGRAVRRGRHRSITLQYGAHQDQHLGRLDRRARLWEQDGLRPLRRAALRRGLARHLLRQRHAGARRRRRQERDDDRRRRSRAIRWSARTTSRSTAGGGAYVTTSGPWESAPIVGKVLHVDAGRRRRSVVADDLHYANGLALSADGSTLFVVEHLRRPRHPLHGATATAALTDRHLFVRLTDLDEPAGACPTASSSGRTGSFYIGLYSAGRIVVVDAQGELVRKIEVPSATAPNLAFSRGRQDDVRHGRRRHLANPPYKGKVFPVTLEE